MISLFKFGHGGLALALMAVMLLLWPVRVNACACCSEEGVWYENTERIDQYRLGELNRLRFAALARPLVDAEGEEGGELAGNLGSDISVTLLKRQGRWDLRFKDKQGRTGTLTLTVPATITEFSVDMRDGQKSAGGGPMLYKEWRLTGAVSSTGIFRKAISPQTKYRLILHGSGNACTDAESFDNWTLQVFGPRTSYSLYGKFIKPA